jgi:hypothetical protein
MLGRGHDNGGPQQRKCSLLRHIGLPEVEREERKGDDNTHIDVRPIRIPCREDTYFLHRLLLDYSPVWLWGTWAGGRTWKPLPPARALSQSLSPAQRNPLYTACTVTLGWRSLSTPMYSTCLPMWPASQLLSIREATLILIQPSYLAVLPRMDRGPSRAIALYALCPAPVVSSPSRSGAREDFQG